MYVCAQNSLEDFRNKQEQLESLNATGSGLVDGCHDDLSRGSGRIKLLDLNDLWGDSLSSLDTREEGLRDTLGLVKRYHGLYEGTDGWLRTAEEALDHSSSSSSSSPGESEGDPVLMSRELAIIEVLYVHIYCTYVYIKIMHCTLYVGTYMYTYIMCVHCELKL